MGLKPNRFRVKPAAHSKVTEGTDEKRPRLKKHRSQYSRTGRIKKKADIPVALLKFRR